MALSLEAFGIDSRHPAFGDNDFVVHQDGTGRCIIAQVVRTFAPSHVCLEWTFEIEQLDGRIKSRVVASQLQALPLHRMTLAQAVQTGDFRRMVGRQFARMAVARGNRSAPVIGRVLARGRGPAAFGLIEALYGRVRVQLNRIGSASVTPSGG